MMYNISLFLSAMLRFSGLKLTFTKEPRHPFVSEWNGEINSATPMKFCDRIGHREHEILLSEIKISCCNNSAG